MKLKSHVDDDNDSGSDYYDQEMEDVYESTLSSILDMENDMEMDS